MIPDSYFLMRSGAVIVSEFNPNREYLGMPSWLFFKSDEVCAPIGWTISWIIILGSLFLDYWIIGVFDCWIVGLLDCWIVGLLDCWIIGGLEDWRIGGLEDWRIGGLLDY